MTTTSSNRHFIRPGEQVLLALSVSLCQPIMGVKPMMMDKTQQMAMMPCALWPVTKLLYLKKETIQTSRTSYVCSKLCESQKFVSQRTAIFKHLIIICIQYMKFPLTCNSLIWFLCGSTSHPGTKRARINKVFQDSSKEESILSTPVVQCGRAAETFG